MQFYINVYDLYFYAVHVTRLPLVGQSCHIYHSPMSSGLWSGVVVVLARRLQRRYNIVSAVDRGLVFAESMQRYHTIVIRRTRAVERVSFLGWPGIVDAGPTLERRLFGGSCSWKIPCTVCRDTGTVQN